MNIYAETYIPKNRRSEYQIEGLNENYVLVPFQGSFIELEIH